jgi:hypothetical protein
MAVGLLGKELAANRLMNYSVYFAGLYVLCITDIKKIGLDI